MSTSFAFLTPLLVATTLTVVTSLTARSRHQRLGEADIYSIAPIVGYLMGFVGLFFMAVPLLPGASGDMSTVSFFWSFSPFWGISFLTAIWMFRYRIIVTKETISISTFRRQIIPFSEIIDTDLIIGSKSQEFVVYLKSGRKIRISGMIQDFSTLTDTIIKNVKLANSPQNDCPQKIADHARIAAGNKSALWIMLAGVVLIAVAAITVKFING